MKWIDGFLGALFLLFAVVQYNDPDPFLWMMIYGMVGVISILKIFDRFPRGTVLLFLLAVGAYTLLHIGHVIDWLTIENSGNLLTGMSEERPYIEGSREFFGLLMADLALAYHLFYKRNQVN